MDYFVIFFFFLIKTAGYIPVGFPGRALTLRAERTDCRHQRCFGRHSNLEAMYRASWSKSTVQLPNLPWISITLDTTLRLPICKAQISTLFYFFPLKK